MDKRSTTRRRSRLLPLLSALLFCSAASHAQGKWTPLTNAAPGYNAGVMLLLTDGSVMVKTSSGGHDAIGDTWNKLTPDIHGSYKNGTWTVLSPMYDSRLYFSTQVLRNGNVYAAGGEYGTGRAFGEVYHPAEDAWVAAPLLPVPGDTISDANSEILPDGKVLQALVSTGGRSTTRTYVYDPETNTYASGTPALGSNNESAWVKLPDNSILYVDIGSTNSERYIPATNKWIRDAILPVGLYDPYGLETGGAFLLPDGRAFFIGSTSYTAYYTPSGSTAKGTWTAGPNIPDSLGAPDAASSIMPDGKILCAFAHTPTYDSVFYPTTVFYEFDYITNKFTKITAPDGTDSADYASYFSNMLSLPDGNILYGRQGDDQYYLYTPAGKALAAGKPTVKNIYPTIHCDTFMVTGTLFNGITEGASYGDDWQMSTNYPIIRLSTHDSVYYAKMFNWNSTGVMRDTLADTTYFVLPAKMPTGNSFTLQVVANGNASDAVPFTFCSKLSTNDINTPDKRISIYPNPAINTTTITFESDGNGEYNTRIVDIYGRIVLERVDVAHPGKNIQTLQMQGIQSGIYTVIVRDAAGTYAAKLTIE